MMDRAAQNNDYDRLIDNGGDDGNDAW